MQNYGIKEELATGGEDQKITAAGIKRDIIRRLNIEPKLHLPLEVLPDKLREFVVEAEAAYGVQQEYTLSGIIFAVSLAIGATHRIESKPGQYDRPRLYMAKIGHPGSNKGMGLKLALAPIIAREDSSYLEYERLLEEYKRAEKEGLTTDARKPTYRQYIIKDYSREALTQILMANPRGVALHRDELSGWLGDLNRYNGSGEEAYWLSNWSGESIAVNRVSDDPKRVKDPFIGVVGTIQPDVLYKLAEGDKKNSGFLDRVMFVWPEDHGAPLWTLAELPPFLKDQYEEAIYKIMDRGFQTIDPEHPELIGEEWHGKNVPHTVKYSPTALEAMFRYKNTTIKSARDSADNNLIRSAESKFPVMVDRLALCLQLLWWSYGEGRADVVSSNTVKKATLLADYFRANRLKVHKHLFERSAEDKLDPWAKEIFEALPEEEFTTAQAYVTAQASSQYEQKKIRSLLTKFVSLKLLERVTTRGRYRKF